MSLLNVPTLQWLSPKLAFLSKLKLGLALEDFGALSEYLLSTLGRLSCYGNLFV